MITIGILFYNENEHEIYRIFRAINRQVDKNFNLIIIIEPRENGVKDFEIFCSFKNIKIIQNNAQQGTVLNRNRIISECKTEYISFIDGDDFVDRNFVKTINLSIYSKADLYYYNYIKIEEKIKVKYSFENSDIIKETLDKWVLLGCSVFKLDVIKKLGGYVENGFEDMEIMLRMISSGSTNFIFIPSTTYFWIRKKTGRNSNTSSLDFNILMLNNIKLYKKFKSRQ